MLTNAALAIAVGYLDGLDKTHALVMRCVNQLDLTPEEMASDLAACVAGAVNFSDVQLKKKQSVYFQFILWSTVRSMSPTPHLFRPAPTKSLSPPSPPVHPHLHPLPGRQSPLLSTL